MFRMNPLDNPLFLFYSMIAAFFAQLAVIHVPAHSSGTSSTEPITMVEWLE